MSIFRCCVGADSRIPAEASRPVGSSTRTQPKVKKPAEVFFDVPKPDPQLSSVTDPPTSGRDAADQKKKKDSKEKEFGDRNLPPSSTRRKSTEAGNDMGVADNNGLTRGQNFMKVEKWLRDSCMQQQIVYTPGVIRNIEDSTPGPVNDGEEPPSEKDRLANNVAASQSHKRR